MPATRESEDKGVAPIYQIAFLVALVLLFVVVSKLYMDGFQEIKRLETKREADNEFDEFAVSLWFGKTKVGFIPKEKNEVIARLMDAGKQFYATIQAKEYEGNWLKLEVQVVMKD